MFLVFGNRGRRSTIRLAIVVIATFMLVGASAILPPQRENGAYLSFGPKVAHANPLLTSVSNRILVWLIEKYSSRDALQLLIQRVGRERTKNWLAEYFNVDCGADLFCVLQGSPDIMPRPPYVRYHIATDTARLRTGPGTGYPVVSVVGRGTPVDVVCQARGTSYDGSTLWNQLTGGQWVHDALTTSPNYNVLSPPYATCDLPPPPGPSYVRYRIVTSSANLRSGPGSNYPIVQVIGYGTPVDVVCQARGSIYGGSTIWNRLTGGQWVHDYLTSSPNYNTLSPPYRWC